MKTKIISRTDGKGHYTAEKRTVEITGIEIGYKSTDHYPDYEFSGELRAFFDPSGLTPKSWDTARHGLIYTDKLWMKDFKTGLRLHGFSISALSDLEYSERGMQGNNYVSMDIGPKFYSTWMSLHNT
jgi:hypothetical protein